MEGAQRSNSRTPSNPRQGQRAFSVGGQNKERTVADGRVGNSDEERTSSLVVAEDRKKGDDLNRLAESLRSL